MLYKVLGPFEEGFSLASTSPRSIAAIAFASSPPCNPTTTPQVFSLSFSDTLSPTDRHDALCNMPDVFKSL
eukprot:10870398-Lingulodinium_polyedra.AAC.1